MKSRLDDVVADAWGRRLEGEPAPADEGLLAEMLLANGPASNHGLSQLLVADQQLDCLLRCALAPPATSDAFVAGVLAVINLPPIDTLVRETTASPVIKIREGSSRLRPRTTWPGGGPLAVTIIGLGLTAVGLALAVIQPWPQQAGSSVRPLPAGGGRQPRAWVEQPHRPPPRPAPERQGRPMPARQPEPSRPIVPEHAVQTATWKRGGPSAGVLPLGIHELASGRATVEAAVGLIVTLEGPTEIELGPGSVLEIRRGRVRVTAEHPAASGIITPTAAVGELVGEISLDVAASGSTTATMLTGSSSFTDLSDGGRPTVFLAGQRKVAGGGAAADGMPRGGAMPESGSNITIRQQIINGSFQGTITIDGRTRTFDSREAFEAARRDIGR